jgi:hypothetical protein
MIKEFNWANVAAILIMILYLAAIFESEMLQEIFQVIQ